MGTLKKYKPLFEQEIKIYNVNPIHKPGNNFYMYVNQTWLNKTDIPSYSSSYSVNEEIEDIIEKDLFILLTKAKSFAINGKNPTTHYDKYLDIIGKFVLSSDTISFQKNSIIFIKEKLRNLHCIRSIDDIGEVLGYFNKHKIPTILNTYIHLEKSNKGYTYILNFLPGTLGLPDDSYYKGTAPGKMKALYYYIEFIKKICKELHIEDISEIITFESYFSINYAVGSTDNGKLYYGKDLENIYSFFPWASYFKAYDIPKWEEKQFRVKTPEWFKYFKKALSNDYDNWKKLFSLHLILHAVSILPPPFDNYHFNFYEKYLKGQHTKLPQKHLTLYLAKDYLAQPLSELYKKFFLKHSIKNNATQFIEKIRSSAIDQINQNGWLQYTTKTIARNKVKQMILSIGWPDSTIKYNYPTLLKDNLLYNIHILGETISIQEIELLGKRDKPGNYWFEPTFMVNAYYYNENNQFIVPAASLMFPFYSGSRSLGWNYGGLGCVIGHEMIHAFDEDGKHYTPNGTYKNWWISIDNRRYNMYSKKIIELYNNTKIYNHYIDGELTLSENLADLGGMSIALEALKKEISNKSDEEKKKELRDFFISYAVSWRTKEKKQKELQSLIIDKHSPSEIRVNNIVCQFDEWYDVFNIEKNDKLFITPENRIKVF